MSKKEPARRLTLANNNAAKPKKSGADKLSYILYTVNYYCNNKTNKDLYTGTIDYYFVTSYTIGS